MPNHWQMSSIFPWRKCLLQLDCLQKTQTRGLVSHMSLSLWYWWSWRPERTNSTPSNREPEISYHVRKAFPIHVLFSPLAPRLKWQKELRWCWDLAGRSTNQPQRWELPRDVEVPLTPGHGLCGAAAQHHCVFLCCISLGSTKNPHNCDSHGDPWEGTEIDRVWG